MGCVGSSPAGSSDEVAANAQIDKAKEKYQKVEQIKYKLLLLGAGESGKSTLLKQMRRLHGRQFDQNELLAAKPHLTQNVIEAMRTLAIYSDILGDQGKNTKVSASNIEIRNRVARMSDKQKFTESHFHDFTKLWNDPGVRATLEYRNQYQLIDTAEYLFSKMDKYCQDTYVPTFSDLIHSRQRTTGVNKIKFVLSDNHGALEEIYEIFDVGGQKNERRKWMHFFDNTAAIIFVAALSGYNQLLWEDNRNNRMREAIGLFRGIVNLDVFKDSHVILFLNKSDLFYEKVGKFSVKEHFKDYKGDDNNKEEIIKFFKQKFEDQRREKRSQKQKQQQIKQQNPNPNPNTNIDPNTNINPPTTTIKKNKSNKTKIHFHVTCATDTSCIKKMFESCRTIIIKKELEIQGFL